MKFIILLLFCVVSVNAQQTIFNLPSANVLDKGNVYVEFDTAFKFNNQDALRRFSSFTPRIVVGVGGKIEVGLNVIGNVQPGADTTTLVPNVKKKFYEKKNTVIYGGTNFYIPIRNRGYKFGTYSYAAVAKTINKTRLTAGGFVASKNVFASNAVRSGGQFGIEQTINSKVTLSADYFTGKHLNGYFTPGIVYNPHPKVTTYWTYSIGNDKAKKGNHFFLLEIGYNF